MTGQMSEDCLVCIKDFIRRKDSIVLNGVALQVLVEDPKMIFDLIMLRMTGKVDLPEDVVADFCKLGIFSVDDKGFFLSEFVENIIDETIKQFKKQGYIISNDKGVLCWSDRIMKSEYDYLTHEVEPEKIPKCGFTGCNNSVMRSPETGFLLAVCKECFDRDNRYGIRFGNVK